MVFIYFVGHSQTITQLPYYESFELGIGSFIQDTDDPAYFDGYVNENLYEVGMALQLNQEHITQLAINSILSSFLSTTDKDCLVQKIKDYNSSYTKNPAS